ncbi:hypothetical protein A1359_05760 [Methylomonas lenta]|uniref:Assimilatory nitrite reductase large subunit n=1 Tax=Methylomonas lenta TaxID=980561 RepID=A0A177NKQ0_9GAMM|nr:FAD-dependent oxidoreductase [Methylomonas lenta]OAI17600.1 hypothetical protein A1359_05760 [Methylomonas lenta]
MKQKLVVIGNGMAGMRAVDELIQLAAEKYDITVFGSEPHGNYNRIMLTPVLFGAKSLSDIMIHDLAWYQRNNISLHCGADKTVVAVDRVNRRVISQDGTVAEYDKLLIATGSLPLMLDIRGREVEGVMGFRDIADVETMIEKSQTKQHAVILGGGLLGLEAANGLMQRGMQVTVVNRAGHLLNRQLDVQAAGFLKRELESKGIEFRLGVTITEVISANQHICKVRLSDNTLLEADILVMATGIQPNIRLGMEMGLACEHGIIVNDHLQTSDHRIYAIGECVQHRGEVFGLVAPVYEQAKICAQQLAGQASAAYQTLLAATMLKVTGIDLFSVGDFEGDADCQQQVLVDHVLGVYRKIVLKNNIIVGMIMYGDTSDSAWYLRLIKNNINVTAIRDKLIFQPIELAA